MARQHTPTITEQVAALQEALSLGQGRVNPDLLDRTQETLNRSTSRTNLAAEHTVVGFFGATGSGKSSLFNAVVGKEIARTAVRRPTTSEALAAVWGQTGSDEILDWLEVKERVYLDQDSLAQPTITPWAKAKQLITGKEKKTPGGLILLDLPDFDSIELSNREIVEKMVKMVDVLVWVFDPQKYADALIHQEFIAPLASHGGLMMAVLNQADKVAEAEVPTILTSLQKQLAADGLTGQMLAQPLAVSAKTGAGIENLRNLLASVAEKKNAALGRVQADLSTAALQLQAEDGGAQAPYLSQDAIDKLDSDLYRSIGGEQITQAAGDSYSLRATSTTGMVATRWLLKFKADPLKRLNLHKETESQELSRSSLPPLSPAQASGISAAARSFGQVTSQGVTDPWKTALQDAALSHSDELPSNLERAVAAVDFQWQKNRWWWPIFNVIQWIALLCAIVGLGWLLSYTVAGFAQIQLPPPPNVKDLIIPVPTALLIMAVLLAILLAMMSRLFNAIGRKSYEKKIKRQMMAKIHEVADARIVEPVQQEIERMTTYNQKLGTILQKI